ncbi:histone-lysine N-methyltransferase SETDB1-A-like isoform X3 [Sinocyclocheilus grahami]|uniref:histone-lysine N-methyltransferase SETDB1-A-like isoform X3 n=1 Tax=Sinocyclocheilus grahami TaxID=75366 RepID=UPI0007AC5B61|nr:PREDICTED: histone-lysine N-methyltransferase SETDB1-A-like isoform X3 [Sinocyclocheilus grahami]
MSSRKDDDNLLRMTKDDLQRWIQAEVDRNPHLMQRREQLAQVEDWVKQKEREATYTHLLYSNACESVHECESVMKGLYGMLGLEYRDEDSEEEGGGGGGGEPQDVIRITDDEENKQENSVLNGDDDDLIVIDLGATKETLKPMLEKVTVAIQKSSRLVQDLVQMVNKTSSMSAASPSSSSSDVSNRHSSASTFETSRSESVTPKLEVPENPIAKVKTESLPKVPEMPSLLSNSEQYKPIAGYKSDSKPTIKTEPQLTALTPWEMSISKQHETSATLNSPSLKLIKTEPQLTAVSPSETPDTFASPHFGSIATIKTEPQSTVIKSEMTSPPSTSKPFKIASIASIKTEPQLSALTPEMSLLERDSEKSSSLRSDHEATSNTERTLPAMTYEILKTSACFYSASVASKKTDPQVPLMSSPSSSSEQMETAASDNTANVETNQTEPESTTETPPELASLLSNSEEAETNASHDSDSTDETEQPKPRSKSDKPFVTETSPTTKLRSSKNNAPVSSTSSPQTEETRAQMPADSNDELSDTEDLSVSPADSDYEPPESESSSDSDYEPPKSLSKSSRDSDFKPPKSQSGSSRNNDFEPTKSQSGSSRNNDFEPPKSQSESLRDSDYGPPKSQSESSRDSDYGPPKSQSESSRDGDYGPPKSQSVDNTDDASISDASAEPSSPDGSYKSSSSESSKQQEYKEIKLQVGMVVLGKRAHNLWRKGTVQEVQTEEDGLRYKVESKSGKEIVLPAYRVASLQPPILKDLFIGCRVVASSIDDEGKASFNAAVLVELPERKNRMRFLLFFDDGYAAYLALPDLHIVCKQLNKVWKDIEDEKLQLQVKEYLRVYPNPIAVVLRAGQDTKAIRNGKFETCTVLQLDGSLIQICFKKDKQKEWIYKGSDRLEHIVNIKQRLSKDKPQKKPLQKTQHKPQQPSQQQAQQQQPQQKAQQAVQQKPQQPSQQKTQPPAISAENATPQHNTSPSSTAVPSATVTSTTVTSTAVSPVRVTRQSDTVFKTSSVSPQNIMSAAFQPKVILQRLTMLSPVVRVVSNLRSAKRPAPDEEEECVSEEEDCVSMQHQYKSIYLHHRCCPACLDGLRPSQVNMHHGQNPLLVPLLFKFRRMTARRRIDGKVFFHIFYRSPCGRSLCDMQKVQEYLLETRCDFLFLEMFCMDPFVLVNRARPPSTSTGKPHLYLPDISEGREVLPVPCVNEVDNTLAPNISYTKDRVPAPGVSVNTSSDFLIGCDCTDGCQDRSKCACHQLTVEATSLCSGGPVDISAGYTHKRLPTTLPTGVYECNPLCRCDPRMCSNRLVQHGLQLRLELFMTQHKGWGIRCRDDVAKGTFVCVFTGKIVNEDRMNEDDTVSGNDYLANLDFIEGVEKLKEDYESEAYCSETEVETNKKTIKMKTGPLWKNTLYQEDSSSGEEELMELNTEQEETEVNHMSFGERNLSHKPHETYKDAQKKVTKHMREDGEETSGPKRCFAIKSFQRRVKPLETLDAKNEKTRTAVTGKNTRRLFNGEETCYIIDARQEGNLGRFINHSCSPNLFVQNVFVDTHDLRFPWVAFFASKRIKAGTELTWDYNYEVGSVEGKVLLCCCGSLRCTGRLL